MARPDASRSARPRGSVPVLPPAPRHRPVIKRGFESIIATWLAGLVVVLPLVVTLAVLAWLVSFINRLAGPSSFVGGLFAALGYSFSSHPVLAYLIGTLVRLGAIYLVVLLVPLGRSRPLRARAYS